MSTRRPTRRSTPRRRAAALAVLAPLVTAGALAAAGPAGAVPVEGDPDAGQCVRLVTWTELTGEPVAVDPPPGVVPLVAVLVPLSGC